MTTKLANLELHQYIPEEWKDNLVEYPDRIKLTPVLDSSGVIIENLFLSEDAEGEIFETGTAVNARTMNNIESGIKNNNTYILAAIQDIKTIQLQVMILQAVITGGVNGEVYMENFDEIDNDNLINGIYDKTEKCIYCVDSKGKRIELTGYGIALG